MSCPLSGGQANVESARVAARHTGFVADSVIPFLEKIRRDGFARINIMHLFRVCAYIAKPDDRNRTPLHELERDEVLKAWNKTENATQQALGIIRSELGLVNMDILWSGALIVPLIALCATLSPRQMNTRAMIGWLALAALLHRYSGASETALDQDLRACRANDPIGQLLSNLRQARAKLRATPEDFAGGISDRSALLAMYVACMNRDSIDFFTGGKVLLQDRVDRHHILPRAQFPEQSRSRADVVANIAFVTGETNKSINSSGPEVYLKRLSAKVLDSQCVPRDERLWRIERAAAFLEQRRVLLAESFNDFLEDTLPDRRLGNSN